MNEENNESNESNNSEVEAKIEAKARSQGWVDKDEYRGNPDMWRDAATFLAKGDQIRAVLSKELESTRGELKTTKEQVVELKATLEDIKQLKEKIYKDAELQAEARLRELQKRQAEAVTNADGEAFTATTREMERVRAELDATKVAPETPKTTPVDIPDPKEAKIMADWMEDNPWFTESNVRAQRMAYLISDELRGSGSPLKYRAFLDEVTRRMEQDYPELVGKVEKRGSPVEGGGKPSTAGKTAKKMTYASLPDDAKDVCDRMVRQGLFKSREDYIRVALETGTI